MKLYYSLIVLIGIVVGATLRFLQKVTYPYICKDKKQHTKIATTLKHLNEGFKVFYRLYIARFL